MFFFFTNMHGNSKRYVPKLVSEGIGRVSVYCWPIPLYMIYSSTYAWIDLYLISWSQFLYRFEQLFNQLNKVYLTEHDDIISTAQSLGHNKMVILGILQNWKGSIVCSSHPSREGKKTTAPSFLNLKKIIIKYWKQKYSKQNKGYSLLFTLQH